MRDETSQYPARNNEDVNCCMSGLVTCNNLRHHRTVQHVRQPLYTLLTVIYSLSPEQWSDLLPTILLALSCD